jgi:hypothetical protein
VGNALEAGGAALAGKAVDTWKWGRTGDVVCNETDVCCNAKFA